MYPKRVEASTGIYSIYVHHMIPTGKRYVGVTGRKPCERFRRGMGYETNKPFFSDIVEYGWDSVETEIIAQTADFELAHEFEQAAMKRWNTLDERYGYNAWSSGSENKPNKSVGENISKAKMGHEVSEETREKLRHYGRKPVVRLTLEGEFVCIYESLTEAANDVGAKKTNISAVVRGEKPTSRGSRWMFLEDYEERNN